MTFEELGIEKNVSDALSRMGITVPTPVQERVIPPSLEGRSVFAESETGTGKTLAFLLPLLALGEPEARSAKALVVSPTRELSSQSHRVLERLLKASSASWTCALVIGGASPLRQMKELALRPRFVLGTPGRILAMSDEGKLDLKNLEVVILDEADRLFSQEMREETEALLARIPAAAVIRIFSATLPASVVKDAGAFARDPVIVRETGGEVLSGDIDHACLLAEWRKKLDLLVKFDKAVRPPRALLFARDSGSVLNALARLDAEGIPARALHGDFDSAQRLKALEDFRKGEARWLVTSDVAARGLDVGGVTHVVMLDAPRDERAYVHRAGRTGRMGSKGSAVVIADGTEVRFLSRVAVRLGISFKAKRLYDGKLVETTLEEFFTEAERLGERARRRKGRDGRS